MIPVIDLCRNNTPEIRFSFAGFVHLSHYGARASVQRSYAYRGHNVNIRHVQPPPDVTVIA